MQVLLFALKAVELEGRSSLLYKIYLCFYFQINADLGGDFNLLYT